MPTIHDLDFAKMIILENDLAEIIVNNDIELNIDMVNELHQTLIKNLSAPFCLLVNKINDYSYDFSAQYEICSLEEIKAIAVICYSDKSEKSTTYIINLNRKKPWNIKLFKNRKDGLHWLDQQNKLFS